MIERGILKFIIPFENFRIFRFSKGIKKPNVYYTDYETAIEKACGGAQTFSKAVMLIDENSDFADTIIYEYYNTKRIGSQYGE